MKPLFLKQAANDMNDDQDSVNTVENVSRKDRLYDAYDAANDYKLYQQSQIDPEVQRERNKAEGKHTIFGTGIGSGAGAIGGSLLGGKGKRLLGSGLGAVGGALAGTLGGSVSGDMKSDQILREKDPETYARIEEAERHKQMADDALSRYFQREEERAKNLERARAEGANEANK